MSPFLTGSGKWIFLTGVCLSLAGAVLGEPVLVAFGQVPFVLLLGALGLALPAGRAVDRRQVQLTPGEPGEEPKTLSLRVGQEKTLLVWVENGASTAVRLEELRPVTHGGLEVTALESVLWIEPQTARRIEVTVKATGMGRASLQGFDIRVADRFGLISLRDYLPCLQVAEVYPRPTREERRRSVKTFPKLRSAPQQLANRRTRAGMDLRELRDFEPGDPLRNVAWKATVRQRRLIAKSFDEEETHVELLALDVSSSMRAGQETKFEESVDLVSELASELLESGLDVGLWTFDSMVYGRVDVGRGRAQFRRIQRHLVGLNSMVDPVRTALDEEALEAELADYLLVQEHLDFRGGQGPRGELDRDLLRQWVRAVFPEEERRWKSPGLSMGVVEETDTPARRFLRMRGVPLAPPSESRPGAKVAGFQAVIRDVLRFGPEQARLTFVSDLAGVSDVEALKKPLAVARRRGLQVRVIAPFGPEFAPLEDPGLIWEAFAASERRDHRAVAGKLASLGVGVTFVGPQGEAVDFSSSSLFRC